MKIVGIYFKQLRTCIPYYITMVFMLFLLLWIKYDNRSKILDNKTYTIGIINESDNSNIYYYSGLIQYLSNYVNIIEIDKVKGNLNQESTYEMFHGYISILENFPKENKSIVIESINNDELQQLLKNRIEIYIKSIDNKIGKSKQQIEVTKNMSQIPSYYLDVLGIIGLFIFTISCFNMGSMLHTIQNQKIKDRMMLTSIKEHYLYLQLMLASVIFTCVIIGILGYIISWYNKFGFSTYIYTMYILILLFITMIGITLGSVVSRICWSFNSQLIYIMIPILLGGCSEIIVNLNIKEPLFSKLNQYQPLYWFKESLNLLQHHIWYGTDIKSKMVYHMGILLLFIAVFILAYCSITNTKNWND